MWANLKEFLAEYKMTALKLSIALTFVFLLVQYNTYGTRSTAHYIHLQIKNGIIREICITPSKNIVADLAEGTTYAVVKDQQIKIPDDWADIVKRDNLYIVMIMGNDHGNRTVYEVDDINARMLLQVDSNEEKPEGCRSFHHISRKVVN